MCTSWSFKHEGSTSVNKFFFLGFLQFWGVFSKVPVFLCHHVYMHSGCISPFTLKTGTGCLSVQLQAPPALHLSSSVTQYIGCLGPRVSLNVVEEDKPDIYK